MEDSIKFVVRKVELDRGITEFERHEFLDIAEAIAFKKTTRDSEFTFWLFEVEIE